ncbi:Heparinase II protein precursor [hydrothermal vent metagenome]|uniref:Heparinase II protein n=1 Tax=hydrothermal vent metagenome TaxID=652676 RepID=A0A3B0TP51_9ZZZZ
MKIEIKTTHFFLLLFFIGLLTSCKNQKEDVYENYSWITEIRDDHPRLFFNKKTFKAIKERALNDELELFGEMKSRIDALIGQKIEFTDPLAPDGTQNSDHEYGTRAAEAAFVYLVLDDKKYLDLSKKILVNLVDYYTLRNQNNLNIQWYAFSRINALAAYDWIYNDLTKKERVEIGYPLIKAINYMTSKERGNVFRRNTGGIKTGFYGPPVLPWYAGIVFYKSGIDDSLSRKLLIKGYDDHIALLNYRSNIAGDDGGAASSAIGYCMGAYPLAEFNFFHTFNSATGFDISKKWPYVPKFINYIFWNWLPGDREFGYGDTHHYDNSLKLSRLHLHLAQMTHFYGETRPDLISVGKWMQTKVQKEKHSSFPFTRFLLTNSHEEIKAKDPSESLPKARHFVNMGQVFMRSGSGTDDTYALFTAGGILTQHRHFDNNNFVIYKKGFLALDSGTRPQPGLHLSHYYSRTVAHNCITIKMPGEIMPHYWDSGPALSEEETSIFPNDGGQNNIMGSEVVAFDEKEQYVYIASDATKSYHQDKADLVLRQFVFLPPDHFVVFDRVNSTNPDFKKRWLLHTAGEPTVNGDEFYADHWEGRLFCKTLFPEKAELKKIGGQGKQFWSDGRNWALPELTPNDWNYKNMHWLDNNHDLFGQWRIEVTPDKPNKDDIFLHLIQVGDRSLESMANSTPVKTEDMAGVRFVYENKQYEVMFNTKNEAGGKISISQDGQKILEEKFTNEVKSQKGLY